MCCLKKMLAAVCAMLCCVACLAVPFLAGAVESKWVDDGRAAAGCVFRRSAGSPLPGLD